MRTLDNLIVPNSKVERIRDAECLIMAGVKIHNQRESWLSLRFGMNNVIRDQRESKVVTAI